MPDMMQFDLVSPERMMASVEVSAVDLPAREGDMTAMPSHAAVMATLRPGVVRAHAADGVSEFVVTGGFAEVTAESATILAETAVKREDATRELLEEAIREAEQSSQASEGGEKDIADKRLADLKSLVSALSL